MSELAYILRNAKEKSIVILDEIGRGTSTYDGLSIAWATVEYLCRKNRQIRTLFATHYHELTVLENKLNGVKNLCVDVSEENGDIVFLHKIIKGSANQSYGIHVAKIAGIPQELLEVASEKLANFESYGAEEKVLNTSSKLSEGGAEEQLSLFVPQKNPAVEILKDIDLMEITASQAIKILEELKNSVS